MINMGKRARKTQENTEKAGLVSCRFTAIAVKMGEPTALGVPKVGLDARVRAAAGHRRLPHLLQRAALEVHGQGKGGADDGHDDDQARQQDPPLPRPPQEAHEEEAYRDLAEGGAGEVPRLSDDIELQGGYRLGGGAFKDAEDGADECYCLVRSQLRRLVLVLDPVPDPVPVFTPVSVTCPVQLTVAAPLV